MTKTYKDRPKFVYENNTVSIGYNLETHRIAKELYEKGECDREQLVKTFQWLFPDMCPEKTQAEKEVENCIEKHKLYTEKEKITLEFVETDIKIFKKAVELANNLC